MVYLGRLRSVKFERQFHSARGTDRIYENLESLFRHQALAFFWPLHGLPCIRQSGICRVLIYSHSASSTQIFLLIFAVPVAAVLIYYDTLLLPFFGLIFQAANLQHFNTSYLIDLAARLVSITHACNTDSAQHDLFFREKFWLSPSALLAMQIPLLDINSRSEASDQAADRI